MINEFEYKGRKFKRIDFKNQYTFEQADEFDRLGQAVTNVTASFYEDIYSRTDLMEKYKGADKEEIDEKDPELQKLLLGIVTKTQNSFKNSKLLPELLAHVWYDEDDREFDIDNYRDRIKFFRKMPLSEIEELGIKEGIYDFLSAGMKLAMADTQNFMGQVLKK